MHDLVPLLVAVAANDDRTAIGLLDATPSLATAALARPDEFFLAERLAQVYQGEPPYTPRASATAL